MAIDQISVFMPEKACLPWLARILGENGVNIRALSIADTTDFGILRLIVSDPARAESVLAREGVTATRTEVVAMEVDDRPGGLARALTALEGKRIGIEYLYGFVQKKEDRALIVLRVEDVAAAERTLVDAGTRILERDDVRRL